jgi:hypothetical protein
LLPLLYHQRQAVLLSSIPIPSFERHKVTLPHGDAAGEGVPGKKTNIRKLIGSLAAAILQHITHQIKPSKHSHHQNLQQI